MDQMVRNDIEWLLGTHTFHFNCFFEDFNCVFMQIRCLSRVLTHNSLSPSVSSMLANDVRMFNCIYLEIEGYKSKIIFLQPVNHVNKGQYILDVILEVNFFINWPLVIQVLDLCSQVGHYSEVTCPIAPV